ncbi:MAG TPA: hypothetical protein PKC67_10095 [Kiritimatiellia bacterium]|nr:hypothetical protein [Kiritimatiellia bacterium]HMP34688.1 hypothetical protein [Kiritimatiellia bacterium]
MKKLLKFILVVVLLLVIALVFFAGPVVKNAVNQAGPGIMGVPVTLGDAKVSLLQGRIHLKDLVVGNPEGFKTDNLFAMGALNVEIDMASLFTDTIVVREIAVIRPEVTYEMTLSGSNVGALQEQMAGDAEPATDAPVEEEAPAPADEAKAGKRVIIEKFVLNEGQINLSLPAMMGTAVPLPLPPIELTDIGKEKPEGLTDVIGDIFSAIFGAVTKVVTSSGKLLGDGVKAVGQGAAAVGGVAVDGVTAVGGVAVDGAAAVGGAAVGAGKAVGKGVANAVGGVLNVLGGSGDEGEKKE